MIGVARWSSSLPRPTPAIMSGSARTTTYVSAEASATATDAVASSALGLADLNRGAVLVQGEDVGGGCGGRGRSGRCHSGRGCALEERADQGHAAQLAAGLGDAIGDVEGRGCVAEVEQLHDVGAR